jgi:hypothetical protein
VASTESAGEEERDLRLASMAEPVGAKSSDEAVVVPRKGNAF